MRVGAACALSNEIETNYSKKDEHETPEQGKIFLKENLIDSLAINLEHNTLR